MMAAKGLIEPSFVLKLGDYEVYRDDRHELGSGTFATVCRGRYLPTDVMVAVKRMALGENTKEGEEWNRCIEQEIELMKSVSHKNIVPFYDSTKTNKFMYIFLELLEGDLNKFIMQKKSLSFVTGVGFMVDTCAALKCLHEHEPCILHRDVKPGNMLVAAAAPGLHSIKLADFGISRYASATGVHTVCGPGKWMAPEVFPASDGSVNYDMKCDVYSGAMVFDAILDHIPGQPLRPPSEQGIPLGRWMSEQKKPVKTPELIKEGDDENMVTIKRLLMQMLCAEPAYRCSIQHAYDVMCMCYASATTPSHRSLLSSEQHGTDAAAATVMDSVPRSDTISFASRTVVVCCNPRVYNMAPAKSMRIWKDTEKKLLTYGIEGRVESVVYPVSTKDVGLPGPEILDAAVITFSTADCAEIYSCLKPDHHILLTESAQTFYAAEKMQLTQQSVDRCGKSFPQFAATMKELHGITLHGHAPVTFIGCRFQSKFLLLVINSLVAPVIQAKYPFGSPRCKEAPANTDVSAVHLTSQFNHFCRQTEVFEQLQSQYGVYIDVEQTSAGAFTCMIRGEVTNRRKAWKQINRMIKTMPIEFIKGDRFFTNVTELKDFVSKTEEHFIATTCYIEALMGIWIMGDNAGDVVNLLLNNFSGLQHETLAARRYRKRLQNAQKSASNLCAV